MKCLNETPNIVNGEWTPTILDAMVATNFINFHG